MREIWVYYDSPDYFFSFIRVKTGAKIEWFDVITQFRSVLSARQKRSIALSELTAYFTQDLQKTSEIDLSKPVGPGDRIEIIVSPNSNSDWDVSSPASDPQRILELGDQLFSEERYRSAFNMYRLLLDTPQGLKAILRVLEKAKGWGTIATLISQRTRRDWHLKDYDFLCLSGKSWDKVGDSQQAAYYYDGALRIKREAPILARLSELSNTPLAPRYLEWANALDSRCPEVARAYARFYLKRSKKNCNAALDRLIRNPRNYRDIARLCNEDRVFANTLVQTIIPKYIMDMSTFIRFVDVLFERGAVDECLGITSEIIDAVKWNIEIVIRHIFYLIKMRLNKRVYQMLPKIALRMEGVKLGDFSAVELFQKARQLVAMHTDKQSKSLSHYDKHDDEVGSWKDNEHACIIAMEVFICCVVDGYLEDMCLFCSEMRSDLIRLSQDSITRQIIDLWRNCRLAVINSTEVVRVYRRVLSLGDQMAPLVMGNKMSVNQEKHTFACHSITNLSILSLRKPKLSGNSAAFWESIVYLSQSGEYDGLLLVLGTYDCEYTIPHKLTTNLKARYDFLEGTISTIIEHYVICVDNIRLRCPGLPIIIHPAIPRDKNSAPIIHLFNEVLCRRMKSHAPVLNVFKNMRRTDVISAGWTRESSLVDQALNSFGLL